MDGGCDIKSYSMTASLLADSSSRVKQCMVSFWSRFYLMKIGTKQYLSIVMRNKAMRRQCMSVSKVLINLCACGLKLYFVLRINYRSLRYLYVMIVTLAGADGRDYDRLP